MGVLQMSRSAQLTVFALFSILLGTSPGLAQEAQPREFGESEGHAERPYHLNEFAIFLGASDDDVHPSEPTLGAAYRHRIARRLAVGALFDYAGGDQRNAIFAASVTWFPIGRLQLMAAPGVEIHRGQGATVCCGCGGVPEIDDPLQARQIDEDAKYFVFRLGAGWHFPVGQIYGILPNINLDYVDGEEVLVYGVNFTFAW
jgi:hypothetical protein